MIMLNVVQTKNPKFSLGQVIFTPGVIELVDQVDLSFYISRHHSGDWGNLCRDDWRANEHALRFGDRLFSSYSLDDKDESKLWIITEWDRSVTTLLRPHEY